MYKHTSEQMGEEWTDTRIHRQIELYLEDRQGTGRTADKAARRLCGQFILRGWGEWLRAKKQNTKNGGDGIGWRRLAAGKDDGDAAWEGELVRWMGGERHCSRVESVEERGRAVLLRDLAIKLNRRLPKTGRNIVICASTGLYSGVKLENLTPLRGNCANLTVKVIVIKRVIIVSSAT